MERIVLALNTLGLLAYLVWLARGSHRILYTQEGVLYLLPCLPFFFVYLVVLRSRDDDGGAGDD